MERRWRGVGFEAHELSRFWAGFAVVRCGMQRSAMLPTSVTPLDCAAKFRRAPHRSLRDFSLHLALLPSRSLPSPHCAAGLNCVFWSFRRDGLVGNPQIMVDVSISWIKFNPAAQVCEDWSTGELPLRMADFGVLHRNEKYPTRAAKLAAEFCSVV